MLKIKKRSSYFILVIVLLFAVVLFGSGSIVRADTSGDAYMNYDSLNKIWTMGTTKVEKKVQLNATGQFLLTSFKNKTTGREYIQGTQNSDEFYIKVGSTEYTGSNTGWIYDTYSTSILSQGELQLNVTFHNSVLKITRTYVIYPSTGVIQEWSTYLNVSGSSQNISNPSIFRQRVMQNDIASLDFNYMTGGADYTGSNLLKTVTLNASYARVFDSRDNPEVTSVDGDNQLYWDYGQATASYQELFVLRNRTTSEGMFLTFDSAAHWNASIGNYTTGVAFLGNDLFSNMSVPNNSSITSSKGMTGVFTGDMDDMGNNILDYIYRYKWDHTNENMTAQSCTWIWKSAPLTENVYLGAQAWKLQ